MNSIVFLALVCLLVAVSAFKAPTLKPAFSSSFALSGSARPLHTSGAFTVEKASPEIKSELGVTEWPTWATEESPKYKVGIKSPLKVYDCNELSYLISGSMTITCVETGKEHLVQTGDFVTFPNGFACHWLVHEPVVKHWYCYDD
jgi:mannose-6-phosphate isomerase-like protein (cupin superfamily)